MNARKCITEDQARALAYFITTAIRPDWQVPGVLAALADAATMTRSPATLAEAAVRAASAEGNRTPKVIALPGAHWPSEATVSTVGVHVPACEDHPEEHAHNCPRCEADIKCGTRAPGEKGRRLALCGSHAGHQAFRCPRCLDEVEAGTRAPQAVGQGPGAPARTWSSWRELLPDTDQELQTAQSVRYAQGVGPDQPAPTGRN